ncbi:MAG: M48 family metalloprotease, partial [Wenzhouxiangellaceae bacterium]
MDHRNQIAAGLSKLSLFQRTRDWRRSERRGLTATQTQILSCLMQRGPLRITRLADEIGVRYMTRAGYNPQGQVEVMRILVDLAGSAAQPEWLSTHPDAANRVDRL